MTHRVHLPISGKYLEFSNEGALVHEPHNITFKELAHETIELITTLSHVNEALSENVHLNDELLMLKKVLKKVTLKLKKAREKLAEAKLAVISTSLTLSTDGANHQLATMMMQLAAHYNIKPTHAKGVMVKLLEGVNLSEPNAQP